MISKLHYITQEITGTTHSQLAEEACVAGADWIQLRLKNKTPEDCLKIALDTLSICRKYHAKLIINDNVLLAKEISADGVHLGKKDMGPLEARKILGTNIIIGGTANTFEDIKQLDEAGINYIGLGPFRFTYTKEKLSPVLGIGGYISIMQKCKAAKINIPVIAIGGIIPNDVIEILETGAYGVAIASAITFSKDKKETISEYIKIISNKTTLTHI